MPDDIAKAPKRRGIQSVEIGIRVLEAVASFRDLASLSTISASAGLSASQTHRYLSSLSAAGMVMQDPDSGHYGLASGAIKIGLAALARVDSFRLADSVFEDLSRRCGHTCLVTVWGDAGPTVLRWYDGDPPVITSLGVGSVLPLLRSANGRVFYSFLSDPVLERIGKSKILDEIKLIGGNHTQIRKDTKRNYYAEVQGDLIPGLAAVAAPVFDLQGKVALVASVISNMQKQTDLKTERKDLLAACQRLTEAIGGVWPAA